ncbi:hypothetical protein K402DRAFT_273332 [Aulographum hederae CBS 113979]|uniref:Secreted protein n=1 Tax=Aulographum hederae CBS 113979 TaxID=1176131 RepID=A0A6G1H8Y3_9PEZI|nr:hypothetical protein K402DRAFT_273332 [Aulographum hederae CBS 113979]
MFSLSSIWNVISMFISSRPSCLFLLLSTHCETMTKRPIIRTAEQIFSYVTPVDRLPLFHHGRASIGTEPEDTLQSFFIPCLYNLEFTLFQIQVYP